MTYLLSSLRLWLVTLVICVVGFTALMLAFAQIVTPWRANGSIVELDGRAVGSALVAQSFVESRYFWPRPSAAGYNGMGAAGSNLSPTSGPLKNRAEETVARYGATMANRLPADLVTASGGGLDPHISLNGALYQVERVAQARGLSKASVRDLVASLAHAPGGIFAPERIVNVLELNLALDRLDA